MKEPDCPPRHPHGGGPHTPGSIAYLFRSSRKELFSLCEIVKAVAEAKRSECEKNGIEITIREEAFPKSFGYPGVLARVLRNILENAVDALKTKRERDRKISITIEEEESRGIIRIRDNAGGIPDEIMEKLFTPYVSTRCGKRSSGGLGLHLSRKILEEKNDGTIEAANEEEGACFSICLRKARYAAQS